uniref:Ligand-gated ion channel 4-like n=1 Tax=Crassostrea virginica TaxID=6565 RepID=A0A8B8C7U4_CRAVI|nr:ligand-gated ion channel 4-like [Crassostrea virginica]XP_022310881.1 ligand-gated ion channel 4-like [Crassostrea virginica]
MDNHSSMLNKRRFWSIRFLVCCFFKAFLLVSADENEFRLIRDVMSRYDKRIRPSSNHTLPTTINFSVALAQIIDVDEKNQIITTNCWLNLNWMDNMLTWNPRKYGGINVVRLPYNDIWLPDILLYDNADVGTAQSSVSTNVIVSANGNVTWLSMWIFKSSCSMDVRYFPFDVQNCSMNFASWTFDAYRVDIRNNAHDGDLSNYVNSSEFEVVEFSFKRHVVVFTCCPEPYVFLTYTLVIQRKPLFYLFNMVMPCILITLVALLGFYMPNDSGEKISMGITTLLSMTVFLMIVAEELPPVSDIVPLIGLYYGMSIAVISLSTALNVFTLNVHHKGLRGHKVPHCLKRVFFGIVSKMLFLKIDLPVAPEEGMEQVPSPRYIVYDSEPPPAINGSGSTFPTRQGHKPDTDDASQREFMRILHRVNKTIDKNEQRLSEQDRRDVINQEWQQLALVIDRLLLVLFVVVVICSTLSLLVPGSDYSHPVSKNE